jgi:hypothetical protein
LRRVRHQVRHRAPRRFHRGPGFPIRRGAHFTACGRPPGRLRAFVGADRCRSASKAVSCCTLRGSGHPSRLTRQRSRPRRGSNRMGHLTDGPAKAVDTDLNEIFHVYHDIFIDQHGVSCECPDSQATSLLPIAERSRAAHRHAVSARSAVCWRHVRFRGGPSATRFGVWE